MSVSIRPFQHPLLEASFLSLCPAPLDITAAITQLILTDPVVVEAGPDIAHCRFRDVVQRFFRQKRLMGCHDHIGHGDQPGQQFIIQDMA